MCEISILLWKNIKSGLGSDFMKYTLSQELLIHDLIKEKLEVYTINLMIAKDR